MLTTKEMVAEYDAAKHHAGALGLNPDAMKDGKPLWHEWALHNAFLAGAKYAREAANKIRPHH